jgi:hypothetical protein
VLAALVVAVIAVSPAQAAIHNLSDLNSTAQIDDSSSAGMFTWTVDGTDQMFQQWFWYRIGDTGPESSIHTLGLTSAVPLSARDLRVTYGGVAAGLEIEITYTLTGGTAGSGTSDVAETIRIINRGTSAIDFHFFQYSDFDLGGLIGGQTATFISPQAFQQSGGGMSFTETVVTPAPDHHEANTFANTLVSLTNGTPTTLNDNDSAFGDATWAFQWDRIISAGGTLIISKDKNITPIPEPVSMVLLGTAMLGMVQLIRRRRRSS